MNQDQQLREALKNFEITGPDDDGLVWLVLHGRGTSGRAMFNLGHKAKFATQVALMLEQDRRAAITATQQAAPSQGDGELAEWNDPAVQIAYQILCDNEAPPERQHWEGFAARRIVGRLKAAALLEASAQREQPEQPADTVPVKRVLIHALSVALGNPEKLSALAGDTVEDSLVEMAATKLVAQQERQWVGLTENDREAIRLSVGQEYCSYTAEAIEAKLREKNAAQREQPAASNPEPQAQAGEPEVVMTYHGRCTIDCGEHGHQDVELHKLIAKGTQLITLQSHREVMTEKQRELEVSRELQDRATEAMVELEDKANRVSRYHHERTIQLAAANETIAKKDAALKAYEKAAECSKSALSEAIMIAPLTHVPPSAGAAIQELDAAITQGQEALK